MNKKMTKIVSFALGLTMTIGVGALFGLNNNTVSPAYAATKITTSDGITSGSSYYIGATTSNADYYFSVDSSSTATGLAGTAVTDKASASIITFTKSDSVWFLTFENDNYLTLSTSKANGKVNVSSSDSTGWTITDVSTSSLLKICYGTTFCIQKNNAGTQFGSYADTQTNVWLEEVSSASLESITLSEYSTEYTLNDDFSFDGICTAHYSDETTDTVTPTSVTAPDMSTTGTKTVTVSYTENLITCTASYDITVSEPTSATSITLNKTSTTIEQGNSETLIATVLPENAADKTVIWSVSPSETGVTVDEGVVTVAIDATLGDYVVSATVGSLTPATCTVSVTKATSITDKLTATTTAVEGSSTYGDWSGKTVTSSAVYAGNSAKSSAGAIQLRSSNNAGIVTTTSGGLINKISVEWNSSTVSGRTLNVYGKTSAYSASSDLYSTETNGTLLGTIVCGTSTELVVSGSYTYVGVCSNSGAMYLDSISFTWAVEEEATSELVSIEITGTPTKLSYYVGDVMDISGIDVIAHYSDSTEDKSILANEELELVYDDTPVTLSTITLDILASFQGKDAEASFAVTVNEDSVTSISVSNTTTSQFDVLENEQLTLDIVSTWTLNANWASGNGITHPSYGDEDGYTLKTTTSGDENITLPYSWKADDTKLIFCYGGKQYSKSVTVTPLINTVSYESIPVLTESYTPSECGYSNAEQVSSYEGTQFNISFSVGTNSSNLPPKYYTSGTATRLYANNTFTVSSNDETPLIKIVISGTTPENMEADVGTYSSGTWTGSATSITFTLTSTARISTLTVYYNDSQTKEIVISNDVNFKPAQRAVVEFAKTFNSELSEICVAFGKTDAEALKTKWDELALTFTDWFVNDDKSLESEQKERALLLFKNAEYVARDSEENDDLQAMLGKYDEILSHYEFDDFLNTTAERTEAVKSVRVSFVSNSDFNSSIIIVSIISLISIISVSGIVIKKRKEQ